MFNFDSDSVLGSETSSLTSCSNVSHGHRARNRPPSKKVGYQINTRSILNDQLETIANRYIGGSDYLKRALPTPLISSALEKLKANYNKDTQSNIIANKSGICYDLANLCLCEEDRKLSADANKDEDNVDTSQMKDGETVEFDKYYGTSISADAPDGKKEYLDFSASITEIQSALDRLLSSSKSEELKSKTTLRKDIEQQFAIQPLRVSKRARKKQNAELHKQSLPKWFDMPRVTEITKDQEKDLAALRMRRVWNAKQFYKKSSSILDSAPGDEDGGKKGGSSKFFQIGTVEDSSTDFFSNDRMTKRTRKQTILDELMNDQQLRAFNKRKLKYAQAKNSRLRVQMARVKAKKQKAKMRMRKQAKASRNFEVSAQAPRASTF